MRTRNLKGNGSMAKVKQIRLNEWYFHHDLKATNRALCLPGGKASLVQGLPALVPKVQPWPKFGIKSRSEPTDGDREATERSGEHSKPGL